MFDLTQLGVVHAIFSLVAVAAVSSHSCVTESGRASARRRSAGAGTSSQTEVQTT
jgi:hypothetical protein